MPAAIFVPLTFIQGGRATMGTETGLNRRPLASRDRPWAAMAVRLLLRTPITPNQISVLSIAFSAIGAWALVAAPRAPWGYLVGALAIQLRLLCNMLDGMVAVEGQRASSVGPLYNEIPDRVADTFFLVAFGCAAGLTWLGFVAALLAMFTAYIRVLGGSLGLAQDFRGPMAKQHRMAALTLGCLGAFVESFIAPTRYCLQLTLAVVTLGALVTAARRILAISSELGSR
jgi:phosphatidylglycerophosphate synthase